jgi:DNA primase
MISPATIQQILNRLDIVEVIGGFVKLKKRGSGYIGLCPFHNERTPSFNVSPAKEIFKCFGCGRSGNAISFLMEHEKYSYVEALKWLAAKYGVEIEETFTTEEQRLQLQAADSLYIINSFAQQFFTEQLFETEEGRDIGLSYLKERGFREEIIRKFQLGYAPEKKDAFARQALARQFNADLLIKAGLIVNRNGQYVDNYRGRIIFPVHNQSGKVVGFGARILKSTEQAPKYINTPENEIYQKSRILYGSYFARQAIDKADECLLVEGYTDVMALHQAGIENVVASGGTSLTQEQVRLIKKYSNNITIIYDGDVAGVKAALRGLGIALEEGLNVKLVLLPGNEDPDSFIHRVGVSAFQEFIAAHKKDVILFQLEVGLKDAAGDARKKAEVVNQIAETISKINKAEDFTKQQDYIRQCAQLLHIDESGFHALVNKFIRNHLAAQEKKFPAGEAQVLEENARKAAVAEYDDASFQLLFKDELQEKEVARILLEYGHQAWDKEKRVAEYVLAELPEDNLIENAAVVKLIATYRDLLQESPQSLSRNYFIYHEDPELSALAVSLLNVPYEESIHWRREFSQATGYRRELFEKDYEEFARLALPRHEEELLSYLKTEEDRSLQEVESAVNYLKLRKVKRLLLDNQADLEKPHTAEEYATLHQTHQYLKQLETELTQKTGTVIIR